MWVWNIHSDEPKQFDSDTVTNTIPKLIGSATAQRGNLESNYCLQFAHERLITAWKCLKPLNLAEIEVRSVRTRLCGITGKPMRLQILRLQILKLTAFCRTLSGPSIQSHHRRRNVPPPPPGCMWSNAGFVSLKFPRESKAAENGATDVEGERNCSHMHSCIKGGVQKADQ